MQCLQPEEEEGPEEDEGLIVRRYAGVVAVGGIRGLSG